MIREERISKLVDILNECLEYDEWASREYGVTEVDCWATAENLYERGLDFPDVGFWSDKDDEGNYWCSNCVSPVKDVSAFCPWCGKRMRLKEDF